MRLAIFFSCKDMNETICKFLFSSKNMYEPVCKFLLTQRYGGGLMPCVIFENDVKYTFLFSSKDIHEFVCRFYFLVKNIERPDQVNDFRNEKELSLLFLIV